MTDYEKAELSSRIALATEKAVEAARNQDWPAFDHQLATINELRASMPEARTLGNITVNDTTQANGETKITVAVEKYNLALTIHPEGTGTWDGPYAPILVERHEGRVQLIVWSDIHQQDPTHVIDLSGALESNRRDTE